MNCEQILPVDWVAITQGGVTATNYQVLPGDRVFIAQDAEVVTLYNVEDRMIRPFERVDGLSRSRQFDGPQYADNGPRLQPYGRPTRRYARTLAAGPRGRGPRGRLGRRCPAIPA